MFRKFYALQAQALKSLVTCICFLPLFCVRANTDSLHQAFLNHIDVALEFQKRMERDRLDSIMDIALIMAEELGREKNIAYSFYLKSDGLSQSAPAEAITYAELALDFYKQEGDFKMLSVILLVKGNCQSTIGEQSAAIQSYKEAIEYSLKSEGRDDPHEQRKRLIMKYSIGMTYNEKGDLINASRYLYDVLFEAEKNNNHIVMAAALQQLGNINLLRRQFDEAIEQFRLGMHMAKKHVPRAVSANLSGLSQVFRRLNQQDSSIYYAERALEINVENRNLRSAKINLIDLAESYYAQGNYKRAIEYNQQLYDMALTGKMPDAIRRAQLGLAQCHLKMGNISLATKYMKQVMKDINEVEEFNLLASAYACAADCESALGNFEKALMYQKKHQSFADSLLNKSSQEKLDVLHFEYQNKQKEEKIQQLELQQRVDKYANDRQMLRLILAAVFLGLVFVGVFLVGRRKKFLLEKQKENIEQRLLRSQLNPHFIFNAISSIQNYLFDASDQKIAIKYLAHFSELMRQILENSRVPYISLQTEIDALKNYLRLQLLRYNEKFEFTIEVEDSIVPDELMVPPLIIQPFVENAIEHGKIYMVQDGQVTINIKVVQQDLVVTIIDNGKGFDQLNTKLTVSKKSKSLGTQITSERLDYLSKLFNRKFQFSYAQNLERGTEVKLILPIVH